MAASRNRLMLESTETGTGVAIGIQLPMPTVIGDMRYCTEENCHV